MPWSTCSTAEQASMSATPSSLATRAAAEDLPLLGGPRTTTRWSAGGCELLRCQYLYFLYKYASTFVLVEQVST
jgi:hypothetical protein